MSGCVGVLAELAGVTKELQAVHKEVSNQGCNWKFTITYWCFYCCPGCRGGCLTGRLTLTGSIGDLLVLYTHGTHIASNAYRFKFALLSGDRSSKARPLRFVNELLPMHTKGGCISISVL
jgi:hypothetical protein